MTKFTLYFLFCIFLTNALSAQTVGDSSIVSADTIVKPKAVVKKKKPVKLVKDSFLPSQPDSLTTKISLSPILVRDTSVSNFMNALALCPDFNFLGKIKSEEIELHQAQQLDALFYFLVGLCFYFAFIKLFFYKYLNSLLALFFRASMRQQQMRDQAQQMPLASLLLNILFVLSAGCYASFVLHYHHFTLQKSFWSLFLYCMLLITLIYLGKFFVLKLSGWIFNVPKAADGYIFTVFMVNKILGIILIPIIIMISFCGPLIAGIAIAISYLILGVLLIYRFATCFSALRNEIRISLFHYFIYLCAFEIAPLLLIYKVVLTYLEKGY
ncbi:MAG: DUF4271 domain-containing protein [Bacteroidetes bacterium]|nr:DUF4271 domain-containing protein [Bacteroidota bacterium]